MGKPFGDLAGWGRAQAGAGGRVRVRRSLIRSVLSGHSVGRSVGRAGGRADGRCRAFGVVDDFVGADTQSGQINFAAMRDNVIGGVRLEMSA